MTQTINVTYNACQVTFKMTPTSGKATVKYSSKSTTVSNNSKLLIPYGVSVTVTPSSIDMHTSPSGQTFTTNSKSKTVTLTWEEIRMGVFILDNSSNLCNVNTWTGGSNCKGVALLTEKVSICISKYEDVLEWGAMDYAVNNCTIVGSKADALEDFNGPTNTTAMISSLAGKTDADYGTVGAPAAEYCRDFGSSWYLPAFGELFEIIINQPAINEALNKISATPLSEDSDLYWSSTQFTYGDDYPQWKWNEAWCMGWRNSSPGYYTHYQEKWCSCPVRPICRI